jgi:ferredoxin
LWRNLQELGGINNSHAQALLEKEKAAWEEEKRKEAQEAPAAAPAAEEKAKTAVEEAKPITEPTIDTARCTTCDECTKLNNRVFEYNENKQAVIKDPDAGTFRNLVEAAERCKVAIIHPGKPRNPDEPGLDELVKRAEKFNR